MTVADDLTPDEPEVIAVARAIGADFVRLANWRSPIPPDINPAAPIWSSLIDSIALAIVPERSRNCQLRSMRIRTIPDGMIGGV